MSVSDLDGRLSRLRHIAFDMDGTIYRGQRLLDGAQALLNDLDRLEIGYSFVTNNSSRGVAEYVGHLEAMGLPAGRERLYTSNLAALTYMGRAHPDVRRLFVLGTSSMQSEWAEAGYTLVGEDDADEPEAVVVGMDTGLRYERLCRAAYWISRGKLFVATHPDPVCPTDRATVLVDCGSLCACLKVATGRDPEAVAGKPQPLMIEGLRADHGLSAWEVAMVGDRLSTDIAMANGAGVLGILVGELADDADSPARPDVVVANLRELHQRLIAALKKADLKRL